MHAVCKTFLDAQRLINIHTARTNECTATSLIMYDERTKINRPPVTVHPVTGFCLGCTAAVQINPVISFRKTPGDDCMHM
jgi:hypothetical protein